jgi:hypothetical protein
MILPVMANRIRVRTQIFKAMPEAGITERYRLKLSIESPRLKTRGVSKYLAVSGKLRGFSLESVNNYFQV